MIPQLPTELWDHILAYAVADKPSFAHLWDTGRRVNQHFRSYITRAFRDNYITAPGRIVLDFDCDWAYVPDPEDGQRCSFSIEMFFDRLVSATDGARERVVFKEGTDTGPPYPAHWDEEYIEAYEGKKYARWREKVEEYQEGMKFHLVPYVICVWEVPNDTELPGLEVDWERREVSFEWEGMMDRFCEEHVVFLGKTERGIEREGPAMREKVQGLDGDVDMKMMLSAIQEFDRFFKRTWKEVRRERIQRWYRKRLDLDFEFDEEDRQQELKQLNRIEAFHGAGRGQDDEEEEEQTDVDGEDGEDEEDEWDDEDMDEDEIDENDDEDEAENLE